MSASSDLSETELKEILDIILTEDTKAMISSCELAHKVMEVLWAHRYFKEMDEWTVLSSVALSLWSNHADSDRSGTEWPWQQLEPRDLLADEVREWAAAKLNDKDDPDGLRNAFNQIKRNNIANEAEATARDILRKAVKNEYRDNENLADAEFKEHIAHELRFHIHASLGNMLQMELNT